jgi:inner membrane protein
MDSITHLALGACIGETMLGKKTRRRTLLWGALAQSVPDIDFIAGFWSDPATNLLAHRGFTHSFLFAFIAAPLLSFPAAWHHRKEGLKYSKWLLFFIVQILVHDLLDGFNAYGAGWFEPFSHERISFDVLFVADPLFSIWLGIAMVALLILRPYHPKRKYWLRMGLILPAIYFCYALFNKYTIHRDAKRALETQQIVYKDYFTTPVFFNNWLWYVIAATDSGYYVGYRSVFDKEKTIDFTYFSRNDHLLKEVEIRPDIQKLIRFSRGYHRMEQWHDTLVFNNLRFGQMAGWYDRNSNFAFYYYVTDNVADNLLVVQRGRFTGWNRETISSLWRRIRGYRTRVLSCSAAYNKK